jgi:hypothetical protein
MWQIAGIEADYGEAMRRGYKIHGGDFWTAWRRRLAYAAATVEV